MTTHRLVALFLSLAAASPARAQGRPGGFVTPFSNIFFSVGTLLMDVGKLNARFERTDLPAAQRPGFNAISSDGYAIGVAGYTPYARALFGGELHYSDVGEEASTAGKTNRLQTTYAMATVGYAAYTSWRLTIYPFLSVGKGSATVTLKSRDGGPSVSGTQDPTFDEIVASPGFESRIKATYWVFEPGLGFDYLVLRSDSSRMGLTLGVRVGSAISPNRATWTYQGRSVFAGPDIGPNGGMIRLAVGFGGFRLGR